MSLSVHLRAIVIAGSLATLALALGLVTLAMNKTASNAATPHTILTLKQRHLQSAAAKGAKAAPHVKPPRVDPNFSAALKAGLPRSVARALAAHPVVVVELTSATDSVAQLAAGEAQAGAGLAGASYVAVNVDRNGGDAPTLTRLLGRLPVAPAALVYQRPAKLFVTLPGFNDRTTVQQAAASAALTAGGSPTMATAATAWAARADVLCNTMYTQISANTVAATSPAQRAMQKKQFESISAGFLTKMKRLRAPAGETANVAKLNALMTKAFANTDAVLAAAAAHHGKAAIASLMRAVALSPQIQSLGQKLGATGCAAAF